MTTAASTWRGSRHSGPSPLDSPSFIRSQCQLNGGRKSLSSPNPMELWNTRVCVCVPHASPRLVSPLPLLSLLKQQGEGRLPEEALGALQCPPPALNQPVQGRGESAAQQQRRLFDLFCNSWVGGTWGLDPRGEGVEHELPAGSRTTTSLWGASAAAGGTTIPPLLPGRRQMVLP